MNSDNFRPLLVVAAMQEELLPLVKKFQGKPCDNWGLKNFSIADIQGKKSYFLTTGVGKKQVRYRLKKVLPEIQPGCILSVGTAGGIDPNFRVGDTVISENVLSESPKGDLLLNGRRFFSRKLVSQHSLKPYQGKEEQKDNFLKRAEYLMTVNSAFGKEQKAKYTKSGIGLVDMETWHIAKVLHEFIPACRLISLRSVSDTLGDELPSPPVLFGTGITDDAAHFRRHNEQIKEAITRNVITASALIESFI